MAIVIADTAEPAEVIQASLFARETLQVTVTLLRSHDAALALIVQNLIAPSARIFNQIDSSPNPKDTFRLTLDSFTLKRIIDTLAIAGQALAEQVLESNEGDHTFLMATKDAIGKWLAYARFHQSEFEKLKRDSLHSY